MEYQIIKDLRQIQIGDIVLDPKTNKICVHNKNMNLSFDILWRYTECIIIRPSIKSPDDEYFVLGKYDEMKPGDIVYNMGNFTLFVWEVNNSGYKPFNFPYCCVYIRKVKKEKTYSVGQYFKSSLRNIFQIIQYDRNVVQIVNVDTGYIFPGSKRVVNNINIITESELEMILLEFPDYILINNAFRVGKSPKEEKPKERTYKVGQVINYANGDKYKIIAYPYNTEYSLYLLDLKTNILSSVSDLTIVKYQNNIFQKDFDTLIANINSTIPYTVTDN
jgi:hypothetical protein